ncbi:hypothetical protein ACTPEF_25650, partial [Clostridioides difficile]
KLAVLNKNRFESIKFDRLGNPAILTYDGIQYKNIEAENFTRKGCYRRFYFMNPSFNIFFIFFLIIIIIFNIFVHVSTYYF